MNLIPRAVLGRRGTRRLRATVAFLASAAVVLTGVGVAGAAPATAVVGEGFPVTPADLAFILKQIKIAEYHSAHIADDPTNPCAALLGDGPDQIASPLLSFGLRTVDGSCNNLQPGQETFGAADQPFPRLTTPVFGPADDAAPFGSGPTSYDQLNGNVVDAEPRTISNLIVDQTYTNPAAVAAARQAVRAQSNDGASEPCEWTPGYTPPDNFSPNSPGCVPSHDTLFIENVTTDVGLSPPFNSLFTIFGQFFDHGLDKITNGGNGTVFVPLQDDDPLVAGDDHEFGTSDDLDPGLRFMTLTRGHVVDGPDGFRNAPNTDTPFVDQSQTYTSHASHQVFLREYVDNAAGDPVSTGKFLSTPDGDGLATWAQIKDRAATLLGLELVDADVTNIPMLATDPYGKFLPGPNGLPQYVTGSGLVEGDRATPVPAPADVLRIDTAFLNDIAHSADPGSLSSPKTPDGNNTAGGSLDPVTSGQYDDELLDLHAICGDGRCNENIALQAVHQVFHSEHDRLVGEIKQILLDDTSDVTDVADWQTAGGAPSADGAWNGERLFQAARFITEMQYQHLVFEEFARKVQPAINPFEPFAFNQTDVDPAITAEFAHAVYRFGHSMLDDDIPRVRPNGSHYDIPLLDGFLNPAAYYDNGSGGTLDSKAALTGLVMGLSDQAGNEIDEFVADTLRNNLLGLPLDLPALNMTRARSEGVPPLNVVRRQIHGATNDNQLTPYTNWIDFGEHLRHPESLVNFVAAYGTHPDITSETTIAGRRTAAERILNGLVLPGTDGELGSGCGTPAETAECADNVNPPADSADFVFGTGDWADDGGLTTTGLDDVDLWVGGLAENTNLFGGLLGSTFNYVFENQLTNLQNGDRFYYLARTPGMNLRASLEGNSFSELVMRNSDASTLKADPFATADCKFEIGALTWPAPSGSFITGPGSVADVAGSECDENRLLLRQPDGQIKYRAVNSVDPSGINGQSVFNGTDAVDRIYGGNDNDTFWGGKAGDIIDGGGGDDVILGGEGNDIITDFGGADVPKGGPGNDAIDGGIGDDIVMGGDGKDFTNGGANLNEHFLGEGDDFAIAGQGTDAVFGDGGDDWEEGGDQPDLLIGD
ncbi:peroxidase family protein, partial [Kineosporia sp. R_H_3]|uniref:peroxidase family protein n=1 Tax=Kineosporia sp. R_H_3 TaxID=1961848 RepID=UPI0026F440F5